MDNKKLGTFLTIGGLVVSAVASIAGGIIANKQQSLEIDSKVSQKWLKLYQNKTTKGGSVKDSFFFIKKRRDICKTIIL